MDLERTREVVGGLPFISAEQGGRLFEHVIATRPQAVLDIGTAHGVSCAYIAAALEELGEGNVVSVDHSRAGWDPPPEKLLDRLGIAHRVELVRREDSSYTWFLRDLIRSRSDESGNCEPMFDFCYLDASHAWTIDGLAVVLIERLLRPGGWLLLDDLDWRFGNPGPPPFDAPLVEALRLPHILPWTMSDEERTHPQMLDVFDLLVKPHPSFTDLRIEDGNWGWARKAPGEPRQLSLQSSRPISAVLQGRLRRLHRRLRRGS